MLIFGLSGHAIVVKQLTEKFCDITGKCMASTFASIISVGFIFLLKTTFPGSFSFSFYSFITFFV